MANEMKPLVETLTRAAGRLGDEGLKRDAGVALLNDILSNPAIRALPGIDLAQLSGVTPAAVAPDGRKSGVSAAGIVVKEASLAGNPAEKPSVRPAPGTRGLTLS